LLLVLVVVKSIHVDLLDMNVGKGPFLSDASSSRDVSCHFHGDTFTQLNLCLLIIAVLPE
jgi:hypothetical protein